MPAVALLACAAVAHGHWEKGMGLRDAHRHGPGARIRYLRETTKKRSGVGWSSASRLLSRHMPPTTTLLNPPPARKQVDRVQEYMESAEHKANHAKLLEEVKRMNVSERIQSALVQIIEEKEEHEVHSEFGRRLQFTDDWSGLDPHFTEYGGAPGATVQYLINTVWVITARLLCFFLQAGFGLREAGALRAKNAKNIMLKARRLAPPATHRPSSPPRLLALATNSERPLLPSNRSRPDPVPPNTLAEPDERVHGRPRLLLLWLRHLVRRTQRRLGQPVCRWKALRV